MQEPSDEELMARIGDGAREAYEAFVQRHLTPIHAYAARLLGSRDDADDIAQETFFKVWQKASTYQSGRVKVTTWLYRIAHNASIDLLRKRRPSEDIDDLPPGNEPTAPSAPDGDHPTIEQLLDGLPLSQRTAVALCLIGGHSTREAAHILGSSPRAVESLISRARRSMRAALQAATPTD